MTFKQVGIQRVAKLLVANRLRLIQVVAGEEAGEVGRARIGNVEGIGGKAVALGPKVRRIVLREGWIGVRRQGWIVRVQEGVMGLQGGQVLGVGEVGVGDGVGDGKAGGVVEERLRLIEAKARHVVVQGRMG